MLASCSGAVTSTPEDGSGSPPTFVSLNPCLDAILVEVADPRQVLALSHYSRDANSSSIEPDIANRFGVTGGTAEEVLALEPDIVLASSFISPATRNAFERLDLRVETFGSPATVEESLKQVRELAELTGETELGADLIDRIGADTNSRAAAESGRTYSALLWQPGQIVPGDATLVGEQLRWAGFTNHAAARGLGQADFVSLETILADPPDILLIAGDRAGQTHPLLENLRGTLVAEFDPKLLYCGGPTIPLARQRLLDIRAEFERNYWRANH
nr:ABC transporter substrate-binding protein [Erythrobacter sp. F6033]